MSRLIALLIALPFLAFARPAPVGVDSVITVPFTQTLPLVGQVIAGNQGSVSATQAGQVTSIAVEVGDQVTAGQTLLTLNESRIRARIAQQQAFLGQAQAQLKLAQTELDRIEELRGRAAFSQSDADRRVNALDSARAQVASAEANLELARIDLAEASITAPFDAVVVTKNTQIGGWLNPGQSAFELVSIRNNEVVVDVPSASAASLQPGQIIQALSASGRDLDLRLRAVLPIEDGATRTRPARLSLGEGVPVGARVTVNIPVSAQRNVVSVHKDAIIRRGPAAMVYLVVDGKAEMRPVTLGESVGTRLEVLDGLVDGDVVVIKGNERLRPGQEVAPAGARQS